MLGIPTDVVDATEHLLQLADDLEPRRDRPGPASTGATSSSRAASGIDADVTRWVDDHPRLKARGGDADVHLRGAAQLLPRLSRPARRCSRSQVGDERVEGSARSSRTPTRTPTSARRPLRVCEDIAHGRRHDLADGRCGAPRSMLDAPGILCRLFSRRAASREHPQASSFPRDRARARVEPLDGVRRCRSRSTATTSATHREAVYEAAPGALLTVGLSRQGSELRGPGAELRSPDR